MKNLERRALLGDKEAQAECTRRGVVLACPFCGQKKVRILPVCGQGFIECPKCHCTTALVDSVETAIKHWNTRHAPPIGRCGECANACNPGDNIMTCGIFERDMMPDDFCSQFVPKGGEENG